METGEETYSLDYTQLVSVLEDIIKRLDSLEQGQKKKGIEADLELEQCCAQISQCHMIPSSKRSDVAAYLHEVRRPKPPSLKEQALRELGDAYDTGQIDDTTYDTIRRALEAQ